MKKNKDVVIIYGETIPICIRSYSNAKKIHIFFRENVLYVTKPKRCNMQKIEKLLLENKKQIYTSYLEEKEKEQTKKKTWKTGDTIYFAGEEYLVKRIEKEKNRITVQVKPEEKVFEITAPTDAEKEKIDKKIISMLKEKTREKIEERLPFWLDKTKFTYQTLRISDTKSKFGSCIPKRKALQFSARLSMLTDEEIDSVIIHELCHLKYANHSKDFYQLIESFMPNYPEMRKKLKKDSAKIIF